MMRILLVDDHIIFRKGVAALLSNREDMTIVGEVGNGLEAIQAARELLPKCYLDGYQYAEMQWLGSHPAYQT